jgi:hypothetical protein
MPAKKTRPAKKKPVAKKAPEAPKVDKYSKIEVIKVEGLTVYKWKDYTSLKLDKIKRYVDAESN